MRIVLRLALCCAVLVPAPVAAQGFFESLFGSNSPPRPAPQALPPPVVSPYGYRSPLYSPYRTPSPPYGDEPAQTRTGAYRTLCVRMCDGFYWPISNAVSRNSFHRDANACRASCGEEARLFYHPANQGDVTAMVDLSGRAYVKLPTAFRYRKALSEQCKCKPDPWAQSELDRHQLYALNEQTMALNQPTRPADQVTRDATQPPAPAPAPADVAAAPIEAEADDQVRAVPSTRPEPIEAPRPRPRITDPRPPAAFKGPPRAPTAVRPAAQPSWGPLSGSKLRWPGD